MAANREPRRNAGNRMSKVLEEEFEEDEFYKTTYGGFEEEQEDNDFKSDQEDSADEVDSDFDISENDEIVSDQDEETIKKTEKKQRKRVAMAKAYKEPVKKSKMDKQNVQSQKSETEKAEGGKDQQESQKKNESGGGPRQLPGRKSSRRATAANSYLISMRVKERKLADEKKKETVKKPMVGIRRLTQEELMQEAEKTERKNLKSLQNYQRLEASRKKSSTKKRSFMEPTVLYLSTTMPVVKEGDNSSIVTAEKMSRDFIIFSDDSTFEKEFHWRKIPRINKPICPVTNKPARYVDPLTNIPYYDLDSFKLIREAHTMAMAKRDKAR